MFKIKRGKIMIRKFILLVSFLFIATNYSFAQEGTLSDETNGEVKELSDFHEIIYPIWHTAYPENDYKTLRSYDTEVTQLAGKIYSAKLPGILRDKQDKWNRGLAEFKNAVEEYSRTAKDTNSRAMLDAAENLHSKFEMMVRIIRPVLKEVDEFHKVLYIVYHKDLPGEDYEAIKNSCKDFINKAESIVKAKLPKRMDNKKEKFMNAANDLLLASKELEKICEAGVNEKIKPAVNTLHTKYQNLENTFE
jgi:hypothetical protein